ncbi:MAG: hypothetical protein AAF078_05245 [Planctomycetota bacterium]
MPASLLILGAGRSGSSATAGLFRHGWFQGDDLLDATPANPTGYFESREVNRINTELIGQMLFGSRWWRLHRYHPDPAWRDRRAWGYSCPRVARQVMPPGDLFERMRAMTACQPYCLKDPRFSATWSTWQPALRHDTKLLVVFREPRACLASTMREAEQGWDSPVPVQPTALRRAWLRTYRRLLKAAAHDPRFFFLDYARVLDRSAIPALERFVDGPLDPSHLQIKLNRQSAASSGEPADPSANAMFDRLRRRADADLDRHATLRVNVPLRRAIDQPVGHDLLIFGAGRSGTSATAGLFRHGWHQGEDLLPATAANPTGYFECRTINRLNNELIGEMVFGKHWWRLRHFHPDPMWRDGRAWWTMAPLRPRTFTPTPDLLDRMRAAIADRDRPLCLKDPRFSVTLPLWRSLLPEASRFVVVFRHPDATLRSTLRDLAESFDTPVPARPARLRWNWRVTHERLLATTGDDPRFFFLDYAKLLDGSALPALEAFAGAPLDASHIERGISRHSAADPPPTDTRTGQTFAALLRRAQADLSRLTPARAAA